MSLDGEMIMGIINTNIMSQEIADIIVTDICIITEAEKQYIRNTLVEITKGKDSYYSARALAKKLLKYLNNSDERKVHGAVAEFIMICILKKHGFSQEYCYRNLEENSAKKGFDGLFTKNDDMWIAESKSSFTRDSHNFSHGNTIGKAYNSLKDSLEGKTKNDPWENAVNHSRLAGSSSDLVRRLTKLSELYNEEEYLTINQSNVILASTIVDEDYERVEKRVSKILEYIKKHESENELIVIMNLISSKILIDTIEVIANE